MTIFEEVRKSMFEIVSKLDFSYDMYKDDIIVGLGASILNGLSYEPINGNVFILTNSEVMHGFNTGFCRLLYLKDYDTVIGFENSNIASPERTICDYIKYKNSMNYYEVYDLVEEYGDENNWDFNKVYKIADALGISRVLIDELISDTESMMGE